MDQSAKAPRVAIYVRVSTGNQTVDNQLHQLRDVGARLGWNIVQVFCDSGISGARGREQRPGFDALLKAITRREVDLVAAWDASRLSRSMRDLVGFLDELKHRKVGLYLHQSGIDTTTPSGQALLQMLGIFSELERSLTIERINAGLARARREGKQLGRPRLPKSKAAEIRRLLHDGTGIHRTAQMVGCGVSVVQRIRAELTAAA
jgi:DNA invertase Pin-like site-specific DNA recombinase